MKNKSSPNICIILSYRGGVQQDQRHHEVLVDSDPVASERPAESQVISREKVSSELYLRLNIPREIRRKARLTMER